MDNLNTWIVSLEQLKTYRDQIAQDDTPQAAAVVGQRYSETGVEEEGDSRTAEGHTDPAGSG